MEKPKVKICDHYNIRKLKDFEEKAMSRAEICCDSCFPKIPSKPAKDAEGFMIENLLMCLSCFHIGCNRQTKKQCMLNHGEQKTHHVTYSLSLGAIWCYLCDYELKEFLISQNRDDNTEKYNKKLDKLDEYVKEVDKLFQKMIRKRQEDKFKKENQIKEEVSSESEADTSSAERIQKQALAKRPSRNKINVLINRGFKNQIARVWPEQYGKHLFF